MQHVNYKGWTILSLRDGTFRVQLSSWLKAANFPSLASAKAAVDTTIMAIKQGRLI